MITGDHEILTPEGWIRLDVWMGGRIACWNASSEAVTFQPAEALQFDYCGKMYTYKDGRIDQCSTPDHKMRVQKRYGSEWTDMTVEEMSHSRPCIPMNGYRYHRGCANPAWIRVLIMTQADGTYLEDGGINFHFKKIRKIERCKQLLRKAEITFTVHPQKGTVVIAIPARAVPLWLRQFRTKTFGFWLLDENPDIFFDELPNWDGYYPAPNSIQYSTCNKQNADIVQALAHLSGRCANIRIKKHQNKNWKDAYVVDIWLTPGTSHIIKAKPEITDFCGKVYCASTPTGYFLVRRNGKVWVTGNSGRGIQLQNLPQNHLEDLDEVRNLVQDGNTTALEALYDNIPQALSELIRTAFIPRPGYKFIVADFSAIEARVLSYLAGEQWRMDLFANGGDIYCQSASQMFHVPVVKNGINGHLRQKGKVAELACIAEDEHVLTDHGLVPIQNVTTDMLLWDGENWVHHDGVVCRGTREVITYQGLTATPDHVVYVLEQTLPLKLITAVANKYTLIHSGPDNCVPEDHHYRISPTYDLLNAGPLHRYTVAGHLVHNCGYGGSVGALKAMGALEMGLAEDELQPLVDAWRTANPHITQFWWDVDAAVKKAVTYKTTTETYGFTFRCCSGMLFIDLPSGRSLAYVKPKMGTNKFGSESVTYEGMNTGKWMRIESYGPKFVENCLAAGTLVLTRRGLVPIETVSPSDMIWDGVEWVHHEGLLCQGQRETITVGSLHMTPKHKILTTEGWRKCNESQGYYWADVHLPDDQVSVSTLIAMHPTGLLEQVYDIRNCGPRHRFVVFDGNSYRIVSNCVQAVSRDILSNSMKALSDHRIVAHVHDELIIECPMEERVEDVCKNMGMGPDWLPGLVLRADGYQCSYYKKD